MPTIDEAVIAAAKAVAVASGENWDAKNCHETLSGNEPSEMRENCEHLAKAALSAFLADVPVSGGWEGLPRQIIMWMDMEPKTPRALFNHLERSGFEVPQWMRDEAEMQNLDHVPSKGTRAVLVFKAYCESLAEEIQ